MILLGAAATTPAMEEIAVTPSGSAAVGLAHDFAGSPIGVACGLSGPS